MSPRPKSNKRPRPTTASPPRIGAVGALALHLGIAAAALISFQHSFDVSDESHAVPVELITIAPKTNVQAMAPPPEKLTIPTPAAEVPPEPKFVDAEPAPDIDAPKFKIAPDKKTDDQPKPQDVAALLNKLTAAQAPPKNAKAGPRAIEGIGSSNLMTASLIDALRSQVARCWSPQVGAPNANALVVDYDAQFNPDGSVASLRLMPDSAAAAASNPYTRAAAEAASRAIYQCQPYRLPAAQYNQWREISPFRFDPRQMMGQ